MFGQAIIVHVYQTKQQTQVLIVGGSKSDNFPVPSTTNWVTDREANYVLNCHDTFIFPTSFFFFFFFFFIL